MRVFISSIPPWNVFRHKTRTHCRLSPRLALSWHSAFHRRNVISQRSVWNHLYCIDLHDARPLCLRDSFCDHSAVAEREVNDGLLFSSYRPSIDRSSSFYGTLNALTLCTFIFLSVFSHARAAYSDPGFVPLPKKGLDFSDVKTQENNKVKGVFFEARRKWTCCRF